MPWSLVWYDGINIIEPEPGSRGPLFRFAEDPFGHGDLLRNSENQLFLWDGNSVTPIFQDGVFPGRISMPFFRATLNRWVIKGEEDWFHYTEGQPLRALGMPPGVVRSHAWLLGAMPSLDRWIPNSDELWWEQPNGAELVAKLPEGWTLSSPANVGVIEDGRSLAFLAKRSGESRDEYWFALTPKQTGENCLNPRSLSEQLVE